ncbi:hypothetical protein [Hahella sp. NBU794]|uniref:hypothetical protein n=1 Tax=Hahella sp. NBU794 TaxID=3422590 RepID=UPI003D6ECE21
MHTDWDKIDKELNDGMRRIREAGLRGTNRRSFIDQRPGGNLYYRKMSKAEWNNATSNGSKNYDFSKALSYFNKPLYRLWMSTSHDKCEVFGNENAVNQEDSVIVCFRFSVSCLVKANRRLVKAHQEPGAQHDSGCIAIHREGFDQTGNMSSSGDVDRVLEKNQAYNIGITSSNQGLFQRFLEESYICQPFQANRK